MDDFRTQEITNFRLYFSSLRTDTLEGIGSVVDPGECCAIYEIVILYVNGEQVCEHNCSGVIEIAL